MNLAELKTKLIKFQSIIAQLIMCIGLSFLTDRFLTADNTWNVMRQTSVNMIISVGMTMVILIGGIDLSVGSVLALSGAVTAVLLKYGTEFTGLNVYIGFTLMGANDFQMVRSDILPEHRFPSELLCPMVR